MEQKTQRTSQMLNHSDHIAQKKSCREFLWRFFAWLVFVEGYDMTLSLQPSKDTRVTHSFMRKLLRSLSFFWFSIADMLALVVRRVREWLITPMMEIIILIKNQKTTRRIPQSACIGYIK